MMRHSERWIYVSKAATLDDVVLTPTEAMRAAAKRGLELRQEAPKSRKGGLDTKQAGAQGIGSGVARARDILSGKALSEKVVRQMHAFFSRHAAFKHKHKEEPEGKASPVVAPMGRGRWRSVEQTQGGRDEQKRDH